MKQCLEPEGPCAFPKMRWGGQANNAGDFKELRGEEDQGPWRFASALDLRQP